MVRHFSTRIGAMRFLSWPAARGEFGSGRRRGRPKRRGIIQQKHPLRNCSFQLIRCWRRLLEAAADDVLDLLAVELIGIVPEDENVIIGSNRGAPVASDPKSKAGQAFRNIAKRLKGETVPFLDLESTGSLWERIQRLAGRK